MDNTFHAIAESERDLYDIAEVYKIKNAVDNG